MIWLAAILFPLGLACLLAVRRLRPILFRSLLPLAALPSLALSLSMSSDETGRVAGLLFGAEFGFGQAGRVFLFFTSVLWTLAALFARGYMADDARRHQFAGFFLASMSGNLGLIVARDAATFYTFFALMAFAAYPLVIHTGTAEARRAGKIYLGMTVLGEAFLLAGLVLAAGQAGSIRFDEMRVALAAGAGRDWIIFFLWVGFGVKAGAWLVHFWLPLAHPVAPVPASAVLSGAMIKAGLIGWIHLLPLGDGALPGWSTLFMTFGIMAAFYGVIIGLLQDDPKANLAYSSISQMGTMTLAIGIGLSHPDAWRPVLAVVLVYTLNHAFAKGALFLGVGLAARVAGAAWKKNLVLGGLALPALAIAGAPWTGGAIAKYGLKTAAGLSPSALYPALHWILPLASVATTLLLTRFLLLVHRKMPGQRDAGPVPRAMLAAWVALLVAVGASAGGVIAYFAIEIEAVPVSVPELWAAAWPVGAGIVLLLILSRVLGDRWRAGVAPGDLLVLIEWGIARVSRFWQRLPGGSPAHWQINLMAAFDRVAAYERERNLGVRAEAVLRRWQVAGIGLLTVLLSLLMLLLSRAG